MPLDQTKVAHRLIDPEHESPVQLEFVVRNPRAIIVAKARVCGGCPKMIREGEEAVIGHYGIPFHRGCLDTFGGPGGR